VNKLPEGITEWAFQVRVICPDCQSSVYFSQGSFGEINVPPIKQCWCPNSECSEYDRKWWINLLNGIARRRT